MAARKKLRQKKIFPKTLLLAKTDDFVNFFHITSTSSMTMTMAMMMLRIKRQQHQQCKYVLQ